MFLFSARCLYQSLQYLPLLAGQIHQGRANRAGRKTGKLDARLDDRDRIAGLAVAQGCEGEEERMKDPSITALSPARMAR